jgi:curved DNA-binding protein CbpA
MDAPITEIRKNYRNIARLLHPDRFGREVEGKEEAEQILSRLVNPAFEVLSNETQRRDYDRLIRGWALRLKERDQSPPPYPQILRFQQLISAADLQTTYRQAVFAESIGIYKDQNDLTTLLVTNEISILNLGYVINYARLGAAEFAPRTQQPPKTLPPAAPTPPPTPAPAPAPKPLGAGVSFASSHFERGKNLLERRQYREAVQSLKEAVRLAPENPSFHAHLGQAYLRQGLPGMAKAEFTKALTLDPREPLALKEMKSVTGGQTTTTGKSTTANKPKDDDDGKGALKKLWDSLNKPL